MNENAEMFKGATTTKSCATILFGSTEYTGSTVASTSSYSTNGITVTDFTQSKAFGETSSGTYACRIKAGNIAFTFASTTITSIRVYAYTYGSDSDGSMTVTVGSASQVFTVNSTTAPTLTSLSGTSIYSFDPNATTTSFSVACSGTSQRVNVCKILLTLNGSGSTSSSSASSSASSSTASSSASTSASTSSSSSSSTPVTTGTYQLVTKQSQIAVGGVYVIGSAKAAGSGYFLGSSTASSYYRANVSGTINSDLTTTPASGVQTLTLGGTSSAYTFATSSSYLASNTSYSTDLIFATSANTWTISFNSSTYACTIANVDTSTYIEYTSSYFDCSKTSASVYLYVQKGSVGQELAISSSSLSLTKGSTDTSLTLTPSGFSGTPTYSVVATNTSICSGSVSGTTLSIVGLAAGATKVTITATYGTDETASVSLDVIVSNASGSYVSIDNTSLTLYVGWDNGSIQATSHSFSGTVTIALPLQVLARPQRSIVRLV